MKSVTAVEYYNGWSSWAAGVQKWAHKAEERIDKLEEKVPGCENEEIKTALGDIKSIQDQVGELHSELSVKAGRISVLETEKLKWESLEKSLGEFYRETVEKLEAVEERLRVL